MAMHVGGGGHFRIKNRTRSAEKLHLDGDPLPVARALGVEVFEEAHHIQPS